jgi:hypothetical protein
MKTSGEKLYGFHIQRITFFPLKKVNMIAAYHIYLPTQPELINYMLADLGNYEIEAGWGIFDSMSDAKIFQWKYKNYQVILKKKFRPIVDFELLPHQDVLTVSSDLYENTKGSSYWKK